MGSRMWISSHASSTLGSGLEALETSEAEGFVVRRVTSRLKRSKV